MPHLLQLLLGLFGWPQDNPAPPKPLPIMLLKNEAGVLPLAPGKTLQCGKFCGERPKILSKELFPNLRDKTIRTNLFVLNNLESDGMPYFKEDYLRRMSKEQALNFLQGDPKEKHIPSILIAFGDAEGITDYAEHADVIIVATPEATVQAQRDVLQIIRGETSAVPDKAPGT